MAGARAFDGTRYMTCGTFTTLDAVSAFTIAAWMYRGSTGANGMWIISKGSGIGRTLLELWSDNTWYVGVNCGNTWGTLASYTSTGLIHVALTFDGSLSQTSRVKLWLNGVSQTLGGTKMHGTTSLNSGTNLEVGRDSGATSGKSGSATGIAHLIVIPGYALTQSELVGLANRPGDPPHTPGAYYMMDGPSATTEPDICGNRDGTWQSSNANLNVGPNVSLGRFH